MGFLLILACTTALVLLLQKAICAWPVLFYVLALALDGLFFMGNARMLPVELWLPLFPLMRRCMLATALFAIVVFTGVIPEKTWLRTRLQPMRKELSIMAAILTVGHIASLFTSYLMPRIGDVSGVPYLAQVLTVFALLALLVILTATSFEFVRSRLHPATWKRIQRSAYVFFFLIYAHIVLILAPSAFKGGTAAQVSLIVYSAVFGAYAILLARKKYIEHRRTTAAKTPGKPTEAPLLA